MQPLNKSAFVNPIIAGSLAKYKWNFKRSTEKCKDIFLLEDRAYTQTMTEGDGVKWSEENSF